jgi:hypothetical protein
MGGLWFKASLNHPERGTQDGFCGQDAGPPQGRKNHRGAIVPFGPRWGESSPATDTSFGKFPEHPTFGPNFCLQLPQSRGVLGRCDLPRGCRLCRQEPF